MTAPPAYQRFEFVAVGVRGRSLLLDYRLSGHRDGAPDLDFRETLELPAGVPAPDPADPVVRALLAGIHRVFGVSYFKACVPPAVVAPPVPDADADFWDLLYTEGMGEFWYRNGLDPRGRVRFPRGAPAALPVPSLAPVTTPADERVLVLCGGGKDSAVAAEVVRHAGVAADALTLGDSAPQRAQAAVMGARHLVIGRRLDPQLFALNRAGALNGHVPISACIAFVAWLVAWLGGYRAVIAANERSADEGNLHWCGLDINHQWSKSLAFEDAFQRWCARQVAGGPVYFSLLRPLSEWRIARAFAGHPAYFDGFTSCNGNFRQVGRDGAGDGPAGRWCGRCPKCVFTSLMLAPWLSPAQLHAIFGTDALADPANRPLLAALVGLEAQKPFDCVGTAVEARLALATLADAGRLAPAVADWFAAHAGRLRAGLDAIAAEADAVAGPHRLPAPWLERLHAYLGHRG